MPRGLWCVLVIPDWMLTNGSPAIRSTGLRLISRVARFPAVEHHLTEAQVVHRCRNQSIAEKESKDRKRKTSND
jgi:hypothetical protein